MHKYSNGTVDAVGSTLMNGPLPLLIGAAVFFVFLTVFLLRKASSASRAEAATSATQKVPGDTPEAKYGRDIQKLLLPAGDIRFDLYVAKNDIERAEVIESTRQRLLNSMDATTSQRVVKSRPLARDIFVLQEEAFKSLVAKVIPADEEEPVALYWELERAFEDEMKTMSYQDAEKDLVDVYAQVKERRAAEKELEEAEVSAFWTGLSISQQVSLINAETRAQQKAAILRFGGDPNRLDVMARLGYVEEAPIFAPRQTNRDNGSGADGGVAGEWSDSDAGGGDGGGGGGGGGGGD